MTYCRSDLHGCFDEFTELLKRINFTSNDRNYVIYQLNRPSGKPPLLISGKKYSLFTDYVKHKRRAQR